MRVLLEKKLNIFNGIIMILLSLLNTNCPMPEDPSSTPSTSVACGTKSVYASYYCCEYTFTYGPLCPSGTDVTDCGCLAGSKCDDSCLFDNDGDCDEYPITETAYDDCKYRESSPYGKKCSWCNGLMATKECPFNKPDQFMDFPCATALNDVCNCAEECSKNTDPDNLCKYMRTYDDEFNACIAGCRGNEDSFTCMADCYFPPSGGNGDNPYYTNASKNKTWVKPELAPTASPVPSGQSYYQGFDGFADPTDMPSQVFKVVDDYQATYFGSGNVDTRVYPGSIGTGLSQLLLGGWKGKDWHDRLLAQIPPDTGWNELFEKANGN